MAIIINIHDGTKHLYKVVETDGIALIYRRTRKDKEHMLSLIGEVDISQLKDNPNAKVEHILEALSLKAWLSPLTLIEHENGVWTHE